MITVRESVFILYDTENEVNVERVKLDVGTAADLPSADFLPGRRLYQGSTAHDISTGDLYAIDSTGTWYKQNRAGGGGSATLIEKTISENGTYNATDDEATGYSKVVVDVPPPTLIEKTITENGEYLPASDEATAYSKVTVNVPVKFNVFSSPLLKNSGVADIYLWNENGVYDLTEGTFSNLITGDIGLMTPVNILKVNDVTSWLDNGYVIHFMPTENFKLYIGGEEIDIADIFEPVQTPVGPTVWDTSKNAFFRLSYSPYDGKICTMKNGTDTWTADDLFHIS